MSPIPASQCGLHSVKIAAQWWKGPSLFPPTVARGLCLSLQDGAMDGCLQATQLLVFRTPVQPRAL